SDASTDVSSEANASAQAAAQAAAQADASSASNADASSAAEGNSGAAAAAASNADSSTDASAAAAANADSDADADGSDDSASDSDAGASASANANASSSANSNASSSSNANASADADGQELSIEVEKPRLQVGEQQTVHGHGFEAGEKVTAVQHSTPFEIGTAVANENGDVTFTWAVPASTTVGNHSVELTGATSGSISGAFEVYEKKGGGLSPTGGDMALPLGGTAALLMLAGAGVWFATSRRRARS
ncbi:hypothetical protein, partial [Microbacterium nanhaiense]|uniref:hypothetical protein n=1 Tax=Microbacterium nanhaiense TaxID=1301026 RepID=UPI001E465205